MSRPKPDMSRDEIAAIRRAHYAGSAAVAPAEIQLGGPEVHAPARGATQPDPKILHSTVESREQQLAVEIPDDWQNIAWPNLKKLAASVSNDPIASRKDAIAAIEAEISRRAQPAAEQGA